MGQIDGGQILNVYNTGDVTTNNRGGGGIVGRMSGGSLENAYNSGNVTVTNNNGNSGRSGAGGIVGWYNNAPTVKNVYNTGTITSNRYAAGGIAGWYDNIYGESGSVTITNAYNTGSVTVGDAVGNGIAADDATVENAFYTQGGGTKGTQVTAAALMQAGTFSAWGEALDKTGASSTAAWRIYEGTTAPLLTAFMQRKDNVTEKEYDGTADVGDTTTTPSTKTSTQAEGINWVNDINTITPKTLTISGDVTKVYDGSSTATLSLSNLNGVLDQDKAALSLSVTAAYTNKNVGTGKEVNYSELALSGGKAKNYTLTATSGTLTTGSITAAPLTVTVTDVSKQYDGTTSVTDGAYTVTTGQLYGTDALTGGTYAYADKNAGTGKTVSLTGVTVNDGNEGKNYELTVVNSTNSSITAAPLTLTVDDYSKEYDGTTSAPGATYSITTGQVFAGDSLSGGNFAFDDIEPGTGNTLTLSGVVVNDGNGGQNYEIPIYVPNTSASITVNTANAKVKLIDDRLADKGSSRSQIEGVTASPDSEPAAVNENSGNGKTQVQGKQTPVHDWDGEKVLTVENEGVNPPASMSAEEVASQEGK